MALEFTEEEFEVVASLLERRYGRATPFESAEVELLLDPDSATADACPALYWEARDAHFVVCKCADHRFRGQFFMGEEAPSAAGNREFDDLGDCITMLLRLQADDERARKSRV